ncbi:MAG: hypothetical protein ACM31P_09620 [Actinomycetota bacterium]
MSLLALTNQLSPVDVALEQLYLDPNNPRFVDSEWQLVPEDRIADTDVQEKISKLMMERHSVGRLLMNMEVNGFLPIDRVIVREFAEGKYVVLEGNRRICAAKTISSYGNDTTKVSDEVKNSIQTISVLRYTGGDVNAAWIFQGLRHISGIEDWSAFNKAKLLVEQMEEDDLTLTEVGRRFGLTAFGAGQWVRGYYAFKQAREESEYISEVNEQSYPYFQELFSRSSAEVREWLEWNEEEKRFKNPINFNEFVGWLYPRQTDEEGEATGRGNWDARKIARRDDIRDIAQLIREEPELFQQFRNNGQLEQAYSQALTRKFEREAREKSDPVREVFEQIRGCTKSLENLPLRVVKTPALKEELDQLIDALKVQIENICS